MTRERTVPEEGCGTAASSRKISPMKAFRFTEMCAVKNMDTPFIVDSVTTSHFFAGSVTISQCSSGSEKAITNPPACVSLVDVNLSLVPLSMAVTSVTS